MIDQRPGRMKQPHSPDVPWIVLLGLLTSVILMIVMWGVAGSLDSTVTDQTQSRNPFQIIVSQIRGAAAVGSSQLWIFVIGIITLTSIVLIVIWAIARQLRGTSRVDHLANKMSKAKDFDALTSKAAEADAERLSAANAGPGVPLAKLVNNGKRLFASWEWVQIWIMGPRAGKTSCVCVPQIVETDGPVIATTNKRDIVDLTRGPRSRKGTVWVHDVQSIIGEEPDWWWNPLSFVRDMERAEALTDIFISSASTAGAKQDAYFESDGKRLLSHMFFAAAVGRRPITDVFTWAQDPDDKTPRNILHAEGYPALSDALDRIQTLTPKQRDGVYGTVRPWVNVLSYDRVIPWIRDTGAVGRAEFDHRQFAKTNDTLFLVSKEGAGTARAISAALAVAVLTEAEEIAAQQPSGRLSPPMTGVLDEVANVVRWRQLPDVYSHYGSRGIVLSSFFQGWDQGVEAFGEQGMRKLWSASNIRVAGSGLSDDKFLPFLSQLVGDHDVIRRSVSSNQGQRQQTSTSIHRERILEMSDLTALPRGRGILSSSGMPPGLIALEHYSQKEYADDCDASEQHYTHIAVQRAKAKTL